MKKNILTLIFTLSTLLAVWNTSVSGAGFSSDLLNLESIRPNLTASYLAQDKMRLKEAWQAINENISIVLSPVKIGIVENAVDSTHPEFAGVNFGNSTLAALPTDPFFQTNHGTAVVGIIGANNISASSSNNYVFPHMNGILSGIAGIPYVLEIRSPRTPITTFYQDLGRIDELAKENVSIINLSRGTGHLFGALITVKKRLQNHPDILFVVVAGNGGTDAKSVSPANLGNELTNIITVGAVNNNDERAIFTPVQSSNFGNAVNLAAPGINLYTPAVRGLGNLPQVGGDYQFFNGTSASAPLVTGVAGLLKSINPSLTPAEIKQILIRTADPISTDQPIGGRLNAEKAVCDRDVLNCAPSRTVLYGGVGQESINSGALITIDQNTGRGMVVGTPIPGKFISGLAFDSNGTLYASLLNTAGRANLTKIDPHTGILTETIGAITDGATNINIGDLAIQPGTNILFGLRSGGDGLGGAGKLYIINTITGVATFVGDTGAKGAIAFASDGTLYQTAFSFSNRTFSLNTLNPGNASILTSVPSDFFDGLTVRPSDGVLFGNRGQTSGGNGDEVYTIDPITGNATLIGSTLVGGASDLDFGP